jgi:hypothetical protein
MPSIATAARFTSVLLAAMLVSACGGQKVPAQKLIADIDATVAAASVEAAKYVPEHLQDVQTRLGELKASYDRQDYAAVVLGAPAVLGAASALATEAAAKKDELLKAQNDQWSVLADSVPGSLQEIHDRIDFLSKKSNQKIAAGIDVEAAKAGVAEAGSLWSKAQAAFAAGNLEEAVMSATQVKAKAEALATALKLDLAAKG